MSTEMKGNVNDSLWFFPAKPEQREVLFQVFVACVASVSNRVTARKLEQEQKRPLFFFCSRPNFLDELARKRLLRRLKYL